MEYLDYLERLATREVINTAILLFVVLSVRQIAQRFVQRRTRSDPRSMRRWVNMVRNVAVALLLIGLLFIWSPQLSNFALSLTAVALAIVIATKEIILNISGAVVKMVSSPFEVGDWIEVDGIRGEVVAENMFAVKMEELDEGAGLSRFTGRTLTVPNSIFLTSTVIDEGSFRNFMFHRFRVHVDPTRDAFALREEIGTIADRYTEEFREQGQRILTAARRKSLVPLPDGDTLVRVQTAEYGNTAIDVTIFCPTNRTVELEQAIAGEIVSLAGTPRREAAEAPSGDTAKTAPDAAQPGGTGGLG